MTQQGLADTAHVDLKTVYNLESGTRWPIARTRVAIAAALRWETDALGVIASGDAPAEAADTLAVVPEREPEPPGKPGPAPARPPVRDFARGADPEYVQQVLRQMYAAAGLEFPPGRQVPELAEVPAMEAVLAAKPGKDIFRTQWEADLWDSDAPTPEEKYRSVAILRQMTEGALKPDPRVRRTG